MSVEEKKDPEEKQQVEKDAPTEETPVDNKDNGVGEEAEELVEDKEEVADSESLEEDIEENETKKETKDEKKVVKKIKSEDSESGVVNEELRYDAQAAWKPKTELGEKIKKGEITSIKEVLDTPTPIMEAGIVDTLLPNLEEEILNVGRVQRVTDSGRKMRFKIVAAVGNGDGYVGLGEAKGKEAGPTIRSAIERAKLNIREVKRGCGNWECGCGTPHTVPFKVEGKSGSVSVEVKPAPRGVGLVSGEIAQKMLGLAGIKDAWVYTNGHTRTSLNFAHALYNALVNTNKIKVKDVDGKNLGIISGRSIA